MQIEEQARRASTSAGPTELPLDDEASEEGDVRFENPFHYPASNQGRYEREDRRLWDFIKVELLDYSRSMQAEDFIDWMNVVERVFEYKDVPEDKKVTLVTTKLQG